MMVKMGTITDENAEKLILHLFFVKRKTKWRATDGSYYLEPYLRDMEKDKTSTTMPSVLA